MLEDDIDIEVDGGINAETIFHVRRRAMSSSAVRPVPLRRPRRRRDELEPTPSQPHVTFYDDAHIELQTQFESRDRGRDGVLDRPAPPR